MANHTAVSPAPMLVSVIEAGQRLGIGRTTVYRLVWDGKLRSVKVGSRTLIPVQGIDAFVAGLTDATLRRDVQLSGPSD